MQLNRGDIVLCSMSNDFGKVRPAVVVQNSDFNQARNSVTVCPLTTELIPNAQFRTTIYPSESTGLEFPSQVMVDKIGSVKKSRIKSIVGRLDSETVAQLDDHLKLWLGL